MHPVRIPPDTTHRTGNEEMDEREFDDFYTASFERITAQVYAMIGNRDEAQECVQEAFVRAWAHRRTNPRGGTRGHSEMAERALRAAVVAGSALSVR